MNNEVNVNLEDCWCRDLPISQAMSLTGATHEVVVNAYKEFNQKMSDYFNKESQMNNDRTTKIDYESVCLWPDGTWCFYEELSQMAHLSDDYRIILFDTNDYINFLRKEGYE